MSKRIGKSLVVNGATLVTKPRGMRSWTRSTKSWWSG